MDLKTTRLHILRKRKDLGKTAKKGVSMHCHTEHSREMLDFVPHYAEQLPIIAHFWRKERDNYLEREGKAMDFSTAHWTPPLTANDVYRLEKEQITNFGLDPIVSLTDHDSIDANLLVNESIEGENAPISLEWTVPFAYGFFHVGVHNLPQGRAIDITKDLLDFTFNKEVQTDERLTELFAMLNDLPGVLVILNHPLWDIELVGRERHRSLLKDFLRIHGSWIHALEINGFRKWSENKAVIELAESLGIPLATGGDRHGCQPNTVVNLTNAQTFEEFAEEIRVEKRSEVVLMPEYEYPLHSRQLRSFSEILKYYENFPDGRKRWFDRVYVDVDDGHGPRPLSVHWQRGGPTWLRVAIWTLGVLGSPALMPIFRLARKKRDRVPKSVETAQFELAETRDITAEFSSEGTA